MGRAVAVHRFAVVLVDLETEEIGELADVRLSDEVQIVNALILNLLRMSRATSCSRKPRFAELSSMGTFISKLIFHKKQIGDIFGAIHRALNTVN
jgi:hypothetical protein